MMDQPEFHDRDSQEFGNAAIKHFAEQSLAGEMHEDPEGWDEDRKADYLDTITQQLLANPHEAEIAKADYARHLDEKWGIGKNPSGWSRTRGNVEEDKGAH